MLYLRLECWDARLDSVQMCASNNRLEELSRANSALWTHTYTHMELMFLTYFFFITVQWQLVNLSARGQKLGAWRKILALSWDLGMYSSVVLPSNTFRIKYFNILLHLLDKLESAGCDSSVANLAKTSSGKNSQASVLSQFSWVQEVISHTTWPLFTELWLLSSVRVKMYP